MAAIFKIPFNKISYATLLSMLFSTSFVNFHSQIDPHAHGNLYFFVQNSRIYLYVCDITL